MKHVLGSLISGLVLSSVLFGSMHANAVIGILSGGSLITPMAVLVLSSVTVVPTLAVDAAAMLAEEQGIIDSMTSGQITFSMSLAALVVMLPNEDGSANLKTLGKCTPDILAKYNLERNECRAYNREIQRVNGVFSDLVQTLQEGKIPKEGPAIRNEFSKSADRFEVSVGARSAFTKVAGYVASQMTMSKK